MSLNKTTIGLIGNPNVGKSTVFNGLTGLKQHTGNWAGKTIDIAKGTYIYNNRLFEIIDLPGTYSMYANSAEEKVSRDYVCFEKPDIVVVICNATTMERNLSLLLQITEITSNVILCVNMLDEAKTKNININKDKLFDILNIPIVFTSARDGIGIDDLKAEIAAFKEGKSVCKVDYPDDIENEIIKISSILENEHIPFNKRWLSLKLLEGDMEIIDKVSINNESTNKINSVINTKMHDNNRDAIIKTILNKTQNIYEDCISIKNKDYNRIDRRLDKVFTGMYTGIPIMIALLLVCFWITISGANYPSGMLFSFFNSIQQWLSNTLINLGISPIIKGVLIDGMFEVMTWVVSVMLPPMAIFFPLFALLEDSGYLPRIAFNMDKRFQKCGACGKQSLTCVLGLGCNAVGVMGCRIIESPRERLIAIITNNFMPCNGRLPTIIAIISMFFISNSYGPFMGSLFSGIILLGIILLGLEATFLSSKMLSKTILKGKPSSFIMEMPSYRKPQVMNVLIRSFIDKTLKVLIRAIVVSAPAGIIIWLMSNTYIDGVSILIMITRFLQPFAEWFGLDGVILTAFILGLPANEIVLPIILMIYMSKGNMVDMDNINMIREILVNNGWNIVTAICTIVFSLMHWPCSTTILTIKKEAGKKWAAISVILPTVFGLLLCFIINLAFKIFLL